MPQNENKKLNISGIDETFQQKKKESFFAKIKFFAFPLFLLIIWPSLLIFEIIPRINSIQNAESDKQFFNENINYYKENIKNLKNGAATDVSLNLDLLNVWVPTTSGSISSLESEFINLSNKYKVNIKDFKAGESITKATQDLLRNIQINENTEVLRSIPFEFNASGDLNNLIDFINNIQHYNTFNAFKSLKISTIAGNWNAKIVLVRYYFSENFKAIQSGKNITAIDQTFIKNLQERAKIN